MRISLLLAIAGVLIMVPFLTACNHHSHHIKGVPTIVPCDDGDHASPIGEGHHDKPCKDQDDD